MSTRVWLTHGPAQTLAFGRALAGLLTGGEFLALCGALGAGKTQLVKGLGAGLGVEPTEPIVSPTFVLVREYAGRLKLYHIDAYRLGDAAELFDLGLAEMAADLQAIVAVEWADRVPEAIPVDACRIEMEHAGPSERRILVTWPDAERLARLGTMVPPEPGPTAGG